MVQYKKHIEAKQGDSDLSPKRLWGTKLCKSKIYLIPKIGSLRMQINVGKETYNGGGRDASDENEDSEGRARKSSWQRPSGPSIVGHSNLRRDEKASLAVVVVRGMLVAASDGGLGESLSIFWGKGTWTSRNKLSCTLWEEKVDEIMPSILYREIGHVVAKVVGVNGLCNGTRLV
ncbi:methionine aminopeptidase 1 [Striga asiatica]|uniref:Methionine aminopeptidase 1 n=1 Tax=Striga asiatica TaxID=4170 RepID=A0A5A7PN71_STRAF|nr:methionine aminopeptidase 1 [Striga asiatica]